MMNFIGSNQNVKGNGYNVVGSNATVRGNRNTVTGSNADVYGDDNIVTGSNASVWGNRNRITGSNATIMSGNDNVIVGTNSDIKGNGTGNRIEEGNSDNHVDFQGIVGNNRVVIMGSNNHGVAQVNMANRGVSFNPRYANRMIIGSNAEKKTTKKTKYIEGPVPGEAVHDKDAEEGKDNACSICMERVACCVAGPCMHACYCVTCARRLCFGESGTDLLERGTVKCVKCREPVHSIKRIFT